MDFPEKGPVMRSLMFSLFGMELVVQQACELPVTRDAVALM